MEWTLRLVGTGIDGQSQSFDVMAISRPDGLGDIANLGLTLAEAKRRRVAQLVIDQPKALTLTEPGTSFPLLLGTDLFRLTVRIEQPHRCVEMR
jgi:hypothetical protein